MPRRSRIARALLHALLASAGVVLWSGCQTTRDVTRIPVQLVGDLVPGGGRGSTVSDPAQVQAEVLRYSDDFCSRMSAAVDDYGRVAGTPEAADQALRWKLNLNTAAIGIAIGPNPMVSLLDFVALARIARAFVEGRVDSGEGGDAYRSWRDAASLLETNAWAMARGVLTKEQQAEYRALLDQWCQDNAGTELRFLERAQPFTSLPTQAREQERRQPGSVFSLVGLDPTAGLDPAVREVTRTRLFAERALHGTMRMPYLLRWQTEVLTQQILRQAPVRETLDSAGRLSRAAESASQTLAQVPDRLTAERKAILEALEAQEGRLRELSLEVGRTLAAGEAMSSSLNTTLETFDTLMKRFGVGEPERGPRDTNAPPFRILDYAQTADEVARAARDLETLLRSANGTLDSPALARHLAEVRSISTQAREDARAVLNHAFLLAIGLVAAIFGGAIAYQRFGRPG